MGGQSPRESREQSSYVFVLFSLHPNLTCVPLVSPRVLGLPFPRNGHSTLKRNAQTI